MAHLICIERLCSQQWIINKLYYSLIIINNHQSINWKISKLNWHYSGSCTPLQSKKQAASTISRLYTQSTANRHSLVNLRYDLHPAPYIHCKHVQIFISSWIFENVTGNWTFSIKQLYIKTKSVTIAFFSSPPFLLLTPYSSPFLFVCWFDFVAYRAQESYLLTHFHSNDIGFRKIG